MTGITGIRRWFVLAGLFYALLGCATLPDQPAESTPYARLKFSAAMQLLALDDQPIDTSFHLYTLRVRPGPHTLYFAHINAGPEGSATHAGQRATPFRLEVHEGIAYAFEAKT